VQALAAPPAVVLVEGEAGIGKSRLVREGLALRAARSGKGLVAVCPPFLQPFTLGPVVDALRQAAEDVRGLGLSALAGALRPLFPEWAGDLPPAPEPLKDATAARHRLFRALGEILARLGVGLLAVEDVHWADEATLEFLLFLAACPPQRISLLVTYRPEDVPADSLLRRLSSRLAAGTSCARIPLGPLDVSGTASLVSSMLDDEHVSGEFAAFLHKRADGVPLAVEESVRLLHDRAQLICHAGLWGRRSLAELAVPPTVRDSVLERLARLGSSEQAMLRAAAVIADPAGEVVLAAVAGLPAERARAGLAGALSCGLLHEDEHGLSGFRHVLACEAVYEAIAAPERRSLHLRAARALERVSPLPVERLARHFREAGQSGQWCRYAEQAADLALAASDDKRAAAMLYDLVTNAAPPASAVVRLIRKIRLYALPRSVSLDALAELLRSAVDGGALTADEQAEGRRQLARILLNIRQNLAGVAELERAIPGLADRPAEAAHAMVQLGQPYHTLWPAAVHRRWLDRAAAIMTASSIPEVDRMELTVNWVSALLQMGEESGWSIAASVPEAAATLRQVEHVLRGCANIGSAAMLWGRYAEARRRLSAGLELAGRHDYLCLHDGILRIVAHLDWFTGAWSGLADRVAALSGLDDIDPLMLLDSTVVAGLLDVAVGAYRTAEEKLRLVLAEEACRGVTDLPLEPAAALARLALADDRVDDALELTDGPMRVITSKGIWVWATEVAPVRVQALASAGRCGEAAKVMNAFALGLRGRNAPAPLASLALCRAVLAEVDEPARAAGLYSRAADAWEALPRPYDALLARERQACCLAAAGQPDGVELLSQIFVKLSALGAAGDADRVAHELREHGVKARRIHPGGRPRYGDQLSPRELEVVQLVANGRTNREIARALVLSPRTVACHVDSAMRKLKVPSRTALAVSAIETGIVSGGRPQPAAL
jgi:DNA-binding CsgD family transcriptional regulator